MTLAFGVTLASLSWFSAFASPGTIQFAVTTCEAPAVEEDTEDDADDEDDDDDDDNKGNDDDGAEDNAEEEEDEDAEDDAEEGEETLCFVISSISLYIAARGSLS